MIVMIIYIVLASLYFFLEPIIMALELSQHIVYFRIFQFVNGQIEKAFPNFFAFQSLKIEHG